MSNSKLATWKWSGKSDHYNIRDHKIDKITIHHMAGNASLQGCCSGVQSRGGSVNYCIDSNGTIGVMIDEQYRAWTSSNRENDMRAVTIEVANAPGAGEPDWKVTDKALEACIKLCVDICRRNGIKALNYTGNTSGNLTMHKWFAATGCPGPYLSSKFPYIAAEVNKRLNGDKAEDKPASSKKSKSKCPYKVKITHKTGMNVRVAAGMKNPIAKVNNIAIFNGVYTIIEEKTVDGEVWGKLKSGAGWICLTGFTKKV